MQQWKQQNKWNCQQSRSKQVQSKVPSSMSLYLEPLKVLPHLWWAFPLQKRWSRKSLTGVPLSFHWFQIYPRWQPRLAIIFAGHLQVSSLHCFYAAYHTLHSQSKGIPGEGWCQRIKKELCNVVFWTWHHCSTHELIAAMSTCMRTSQPTSQHG